MKTALIIIGILAAVAIGFAIYFAMKKKQDQRPAVSAPVASIVPVSNPVSTIEQAKYRAAVGADVI